MTIKYHKNIKWSTCSCVERNNTIWTLYLWSRFVFFLLNVSLTDLPYVIWKLIHVDPHIILCAGPPPVHQLIRNDKTEKPPTVTVSSAPTFSSVLRPEDGHRGIESPHSQTGMYSPHSFRRFSNLQIIFLSTLRITQIWLLSGDSKGWTRHLQMYILILWIIYCNFYWN